MTPRGQTIPDDLREAAGRWLDDLEQKVSAIQSNANRLPEADAHMLAEATDDTMNTLRFARAILAGEVALGQRPDSRWVPVKQPSPALAAIIHSNGGHLGGTPHDLVELAKASLPEEQRRPFLLMIADVLGSVFTNLSRAVWDDYPEYAPPGWDTN
ncbi:MAG: hypothetical protein EOO73_35750 [Myxococcales bacterium]|nr:MAG: hypothetical protein EOO73_35750 [Myxococcales bacterium]